MNMQDLVTDFEWTTEDLQQKLDELNKKLAIQDLESYTMEEFLDEFFRVDSKTGKYISSGYVINDGEAYFAKEEDAQEYIQKHFGDNATLDELYESGNIYWTEWLE